MRFMIGAWPSGLVPEVWVDYGAVRWSRQQMFVADPLGNLTEAADVRSCLATVCALLWMDSCCLASKRNNMLCIHYSSLNCKGNPLRTTQPTTLSECFSMRRGALTHPGPGLLCAPPSIRYTPTFVTLLEPSIESATTFFQKSGATCKLLILANTTLAHKSHPWIHPSNQTRKPCA